MDIEKNTKPEKNVKYDETQIITGRRRRQDDEYYSEVPYDSQQGEGYYLQQNVAGRPVYVQGPPPPPRNAARGAPIQRREPPLETFDEDVFRHSFDSTTIRHRFIRKVYLLLSVLLAYTTGVIALFVFEENCNKFARKYWYVAYITMIISFIFYIVLACVQSLRRKFPINLILLFVFTIISSITYGIIAALYSQDIVLYAAGITTGICLLITLLACQPWIDITGWGKYLCIISIIVSLIGMIILILHFTVGVGRIVHLIYSVIIAIVCCLYFLYVTQLIIGGKRYSLSPEEYILGTIILYVEIMHLFVAIMSIFGLARGSG